MSSASPEGSENDIFFYLQLSNSISSRQEMILCQLGTIGYFAVQIQQCNILGREAAFLPTEGNSAEIPSNAYSTKDLKSILPSVWRLLREQKKTKNKLWPCFLHIGLSVLCNKNQREKILLQSKKKASHFISSNTLKFYHPQRQS